ncbi:hypothetical protein [Streptomyces sp. NPDC004435]|uniref:hypothetical protein n=1 Tax=Streptomyces sp. NPDC004435 TaxID=3364701 RepID=UPI00368D0936
MNIDSVNVCPGWLSLVTYSTTKAGLLGLPRSLARELRQRRAPTLPVGHSPVFKGFGIGFDDA